MSRATPPATPAWRSSRRRKARAPPSESILSSCGRIGPNRLISPAAALLFRSVSSRIFELHGDQAGGAFSVAGRDCAKRLVQCYRRGAADGGELLRAPCRGDAIG